MGIVGVWVASACTCGCDCAAAVSSIATIRSHEMLGYFLSKLWRWSSCLHRAEIRLNDSGHVARVVLRVEKIEH